MDKVQPKIIIIHIVITNEGDPYWRTLTAAYRRHACALGMLAYGLTILVKMSQDVSSLQVKRQKKGY